MSSHEQFADDLALLAMGALQGDERVALEKHLEGCASCRRELEQLRGDTALLALSTAGPSPPQRSRERLLKAIAKEPRETARAAVAPRRAWNLVPWLAAAVFALAAVFFFRQSDRLSQQVAALQSDSAQQQAQLERAREVVSTLTSTDALRVTLIAAQTLPQPQGKAIYVRDRSSLVFIASNMPALPAQKAYELWLIPPPARRFQQEFLNLMPTAALPSLNRRCRRESRQKHLRLRSSQSKAQPLPRCLS